MSSMESRAAIYENWSDFLFCYLHAVDHTIEHIQGPISGMQTIMSVYMYQYHKNIARHIVHVIIPWPNHCNQQPQCVYACVHMRVHENSTAWCFITIFSYIVSIQISQISHIHVHHIWSHQVTMEWDRNAESHNTRMQSRQWETIRNPMGMEWEWLTTDKYGDVRK